MKHNQEALNQNPRSKDLTLKIKSKYSVLKVQHQLHLYGLYDDDLSDLIADPTELIRALYNRTNTNSNESKCDVNKVAEEFASLFGLNFYDIQVSLLKQWLATQEEGNTLEQTYYGDELNSTMSPTVDDDESANVCVEKYAIRFLSLDEHFKLIICCFFQGVLYTEVLGCGQCITVYHQ